MAMAYIDWSIISLINWLIDQVNWLRGHPKEAFDMATRARAFTLHHLSRSAVLHDLASLLLGYHLVGTISASSTTTTSSSTTTTMMINNKAIVNSNIKDKSHAFNQQQSLSILPEVKIHLWKQFQKQSELIKTLQSSQQSIQQQHQQQQQKKRQTSERSNRPVEVVSHPN